MPIPIKRLEDIAKKWAKVTPEREEYYESGVATTPKNWAEITIAAADTWHDAVKADVAKRLFAYKVKTRGTEGWRSRTLAKKDRWGPGIRIGEDEYMMKFKPFYETIAALELPPKRPAGDVRNYERSKVVGMALRKKKEELAGVTS